MKKILTLFLCFTVYNVFAQPANDICTNATATVSDGTCYAGTLAAAGDHLGGEAGCATPGNANQHRDVWYTFTATTNTVNFNIGGGTLANVEMILASGTCAGLTLIASSCGAAPLTGTFTGLTPGTVYTYIISSPSNATGTFNTCFTSVAAPAGSGQNCGSGSQVCTSAPFSGNSSGFGVQDLNAGNQGCLSIEHNSSWYVISIGTTGTLSMTISPSNTNDDYDFAFWGPNSQCPPNTAPIRCSWAATTGNTGLGNGAGDNSEGAAGNGWVAPINVIAGETYVVLVDGYTAAAQPFNLNWGGSSGLSCVPVIVLPVELISFQANLNKNKVELVWATATETNNDFFTIERSKDGYTYEEVAKVEGAGNSSSIHEYMETDFNPMEGVSYYRLKQTDYNGMYTYSNVVPVEYHSNGDFGFSIFPNPGNARDIKVQLNASKGQEILVVVRDLTGREFYSKVIIVETANGQIEAIDNNENIAPGVYIVTASSENALYSQRLIIKPK